ncbi:YjcZ family sporulation protein [Neobacillus sp. OS1-2]|uniref:YjcZ family sporulation protein n=1 Tax=Neobacillus sp. OS1-2 TaxID=3070680 RepID=UPI0027E0C7F0|nr:YjcZ family sporulation protein [Neobacillus sp. OS1-2]WML41510.1 YjcZ family sporulation protein [Neobacillus sp. OS1-2]
MHNALPSSNAFPNAVPNAVPNALPNAIPNALPIMPHIQPMACSYATPVYADCLPAQGCGDFILIVVLFILLIIVGAVCFCG